MKTTKLLKGLAFLSALTLVFTFGSCKKDSEDEPTSVSKTGLLTSSGWVISSGTMTWFGQTISITDSMDPCEKDDIMNFKSDKTILYDAGALKCDPSEPQTENGGSWAFENNETELVVNEGGDITSFDIVTLSSTTLKITAAEYDSTFMTDIIITVEFKH